MAQHNISGSAAEGEVCRYLESQRYKIVDKNWKTQWCEVDVIAQKNRCMYFVEVKYRSSGEQGGGFDYITPAKVRQMQRAADSWVTLNNWEGEYCLSAAEVSGSDFQVEFIEEI